MDRTAHQREFPYKKGRVRLIGEHTTRDAPQYVDSADGNADELALALLTTWVEAQRAPVALAPPVVEVMRGRAAPKAVLCGCRVLA